MDNWRSEQINGVELFYTDSGGAGRSVVFSHGFGMDHTMFDLQVNALANDYRVITWDQRAGAHRRHRGRSTCGDSANDLSALLHHLLIQSAVSLGCPKVDLFHQGCAACPKPSRSAHLIGSQSASKRERNPIR